MHIYVITNGIACKIGVARDIDNRVYGMQTASPVPLDVRYRLKCKNSRTAYKIESIAHKILSGRRMEGEWFSCSMEEAVLAISEAVLEFAASDYGFIDMPRGGEMALSSRAMRYVRHMCTRYGLKPADVVDEAMVEYFGPIVDGGKPRSGKPKDSRGEVARSAIIDALKNGRVPVSKLRTKKGVGVLDDGFFDSKIKEMVDEGYIEISRAGRGDLALPGPKLNSSDFPQ